MRYEDFCEGVYEHMFCEEEVKGIEEDFEIETMLAYMEDKTSGEFDYFQFAYDQIKNIA